MRAQQTGHLTDLALSPRERHLRRGDASDLEAAVRHAKEAVRLSRRGTGLADSSSNLATLLATRYELTRNLADLDRSIGATVTAMVNTPAGHVDRGGQSTDLAMAFVDRFDRTGDDADLRRGADAAERAVGTSRSGTPQHAEHLYDLGVVLWEHGHVGVGSTMSAADRLREATLTSATVPLLRMRAAESWAGSRRATATGARRPARGTPRSRSWRSPSRSTACRIGSVEAVDEAGRRPAPSRLRAEASVGTAWS